MSSTWVPKPRRAADAYSGESRWPAAGTSRPTQPQSTTTESLGPYTYFSQGNPGSFSRRGSQREVTSPTQPQHRPGSAAAYQPVTPPSSPPRDEASGPAVRVPPAPSSKRVIHPQREIKSPTAGNLRSSKVSPRSSVVGRNCPRCICHRDHSKIMCYVCGKTQVGRVRMQCPEHPNTIHLMDYDQCPACKAVNVAEMRPH